MSAFVVAIVVVIGLLLGALLNIVVIRLPRERAMGGWPRCTRCGARLALWQQLPLVGWLVQGGRGRCCGQRLHWIFPLIEVATAVTLVLLYSRYGLSAPFFYLAFVAVVLIVTGAIDWLHRSIYTFFVLIPALVVVIASAFVPGHTLRNAIIGLLVAGFMFVLMFILARILFPARSAPFGLGDVYLGIFIGAAVGMRNLLPSLFYGILLAGIFSAGVIVARRAGRDDTPEYISYGTFLCIGALGYLLVWGLEGA